MKRKRDAISRREFLIRAGVILPAMHAGLFSLPAWCATEARPELAIRELSLQTQDVRAQRAFYADMLELPIIGEDESCVTIQAGATRLRFARSAAQNNPFYHFAFSIPENKLDKAIEWTRGRAKILTWHKTGRQIVHFKRWNAHAVYFFDPAGNIVEFIAHHTLDNAADGSFSPTDILHVNEIGLVAESVPKLVDELEAKVEVKPYQGWSPGFAAVGDPRGMFICAKRGRIWLPTKDRGARPFGVRVKLESRLRSDAIKLKSIPDVRIEFGV